MSGLSDYRPDIYVGKDPFLFISYHPDDRDSVLPVLEKLDRRGFRFWLNDGIAPGMEADEIIAAHIESCEFFLAFLSKRYLDSLDTVDELNYSRDVDKEYLLIYLEDVALPAGLDMRFMRAQSIKAYASDDEAVYNQLLNLSGAERFYGIADPRLRGKADKLFDSLEALYPEHKVFALEAVAKQLSKSISALYVEAGYPSAQRLMLDYGFSQISTEEARSLRSSVLYQPGFEPETVKPRIDYIMDTLSADYPDKAITDVLQKSHKSIHRSLQGLSVWLGYDTLADMLQAYGFTGFSSDPGRREIDYAQILGKLNNKYAGAERPHSLSQLTAENPDLSASLKTLHNRSAELFGMPLLQYLKGIGLIVPAEKEEKTTVTAQNRVLIIEEIKKLYENSSLDYGTFEDAAETLDQIGLKQSKKGLVYVYDCSSCSETMRIPYGVDYISREAFAGQSDMVTLILPPTVKEIRESAFSDCAGLETLVLPEGLERIGNYAFSNCTSLKKVVFPASLKAIGNEAFAGCEELEEVSFGNVRTNVQEDAFDGCIYELADLQDENASPAEYFELKVDKKNNAKITAYTGDEEVVVIPAMIAGHPIVSIEKGSFKGNESIREVFIHDHITAVNGDAFKDCSRLEKVHLSEAVSRLTGSAFSGCTSLTEINIPDNMTDVTKGLFRDSPLTTIYIGKQVQRISPDAFYKGEADFASGLYFKKKVLERLIIDTGNETFSADGSTLFSRDGRILIAELGDPVKAVIPEGVEEIGPQAFEKIGVLSEVVFPSSLKKIGEKAFLGTNLKTLELPRTIEEIGPQAFSYCRVLSSVELYDGLKVIGQQAFEGCPIQDVYIPATVETLGPDSFLAISTYQGEIAQRFRVDSANEAVYTDGIALYQKTEEGVVLMKAFHPGLRLRPGEEGPAPMVYQVAEGTTVIAPQAFARCNNLDAVEFPEGLLSIGDMAFWDCVRLTAVHLPESCADVSPKAFFGINIELT